MTSLSDEMREIKRGTDEILLEADLQERLESKVPLRVKLGLDPTSPDIHLGHTVVMNKMRQLQDMGHDMGHDMEPDIEQESDELPSRGRNVGESSYARID